MARFSQSLPASFWRLHERDGSLPKEMDLSIAERTIAEAGIKRFEDGAAVGMAFPASQLWADRRTVVALVVGPYKMEPND